MVRDVNEARDYEARTEGFQAKACPSTSVKS